MTESKPVFNFKNTSKEWAKKFNQSMRAATTAHRIMDMALPDTVEELIARDEQATAIMEAESQKQAELICQVLQSVPASWLLEGASEDLDWSDPESLEYIRADRYAELLDMVVMASDARRSAKN